MARILCMPLSMSMLQILLFVAIELLLKSEPVEAACQPADDCTSCIIQGPECTWCYKKGYSTSKRCGTLEGHRKQGCGEEHIMNLESSTMYLQNETVRDANISRSLKAVQISPQKIKLTLIPGRPVTIPITFRIADDYPVDLYYIMDLSYSMRDDQQKLISLGELIANELKKITRDVRLGFGAFVDKATTPFAGMRPETIDNPCFPTATCDMMYGFRNQLSLTSNISLFGDKVRDTPISGNQDSPEGGLDALLQAMVCQRIIGWRQYVRRLIIYASDQPVHIAGDGMHDIGWRSDSRKIVLFSTDARSHISGDAKLAGILEPNDGYCHLKDNVYSHTLIQDYPSISQIAYESKRTSTSIIFAVNSYTEEYKQIAKLIPSSVVGQLASDSSNIVQIVKEKYDSLIKTVKLGPSGLSDDDGIKVVMRADCGSGKMSEENVCDSVKITDEVKFEAEVSITSCKNSGPKKFYIKPGDLADSIELEVDMICDCPCNDEEEYSEQCSMIGTYKCGQCNCKDGFTGQSCECDKKTAKPPDACLNPDTNVTCSGLGECDNCGVCQCHCLPHEDGPDCTTYSGKFCQCNAKGCSQSEGKICSGNGECMCDKLSSKSYCKCDLGFMGNDCSCPVSDYNCRAENGTGEVCNGHGDCLCGVCDCTDDCYEGKTCEILKPECSRACISFRDCVACQVKPTEIIGCDQKSDCDTYSVNYVSTMKIDDACVFTDEKNCNHYFKYTYRRLNDTWDVNILNEPRCLKDYWLEIIIGLCAAVLLLGILALIIWKIVVTIHDKREYARFEREASQAKWKSTNNPIYQPATSTFRNPMYAGSTNGGKMSKEEEENGNLIS